jgi:deoxyadenosine/deoxycytidine kinase
MVLIEGQIGVGKTTIGEIIEERFGLPLYRELGNPVTGTLLDRYYADRHRWAFTTQTHFLAERFRMIQELPAEKPGVMDRSIYGDRIFAEMLAAQGFMDQEEYATYCAIFEAIVTFIPEPRLLIYLDCSVDTAMDRIRRRNRGLEPGIPRDYLENLNSRYLAWYHAYNLSPRLFINTEEFRVDTQQELEPVVRQIERAIHQFT